MSKFLFLSFAFLFVTSAHAAILECQNLGGNYFFVDVPMRSIHISQNGCSLTIIHQTDDNIGAPLVYSGDGAWIEGSDSKYFKEIHSGLALKDSYILETKILDREAGKWTDQKDTLRKTADENIVMTTVYKDGNTTINSSHLLQKSE